MTKRLTLDLGVRFYMMPPWNDLNKTWAGFFPGSWSAAQAPRLYTYGKDASGKVIAVDPLNATNTRQAVYVGLYVLDASGKVIGNPANGFKAQGQDGAPNTIYTNASLAPAYRFGFAWDVAGDGRTAVRGGVGTFFDRNTNNDINQMSGLPPVAYTPLVYYTSMSSVASATKAIGPVGTATFLSGDQHLRQSINGSFGIQRSVGFGTVVDASYVFALARHTLWRKDLNNIALFSQYAAANANPTNLSQALPNIFFGPYQGLGVLSSGQYAGSSNYNALQVSVNRRLSHGVQFGLAYTFAKTITVGSPSYYFETNMRNRVKGGNAPHVAVINYSYQIPALGKKLGSRILGAVTDRWTLSGITTISSGSWNTASFSYNTTVNQTGSAGDAARINVLSNPNISSSDKTYFQQFDVNAFAPPAPCKNPTTSVLTLTLACFGNGNQNYLSGPGWTNWDMTLGKQIPIGLGERCTLQFRVEAYNVWNHAEFNAMGTAAQYTIAGTRILTGTAGQFGQLTATRNPRQMAMTLRFSF